MSEIMQELEQAAATWPERAKDVAIVDQRSYDRAAEMLVGIKALRRQVDASYNPVIEAAHRSHKAAIAAKKKVEAPLERAETILRTAISSWMREQERLRLEVEQKAREEQARLEQEVRLARAAEAESLGAPEEVISEILDRRTEMPPPVVAQTFDKAEGISSRAVWKWEVTDAGKIPREYLSVNEVKINGVVRAMEAATEIPGIRVYQDSTLVVRRT
jgi:hypothetical protein